MFKQHINLMFEHGFSFIRQRLQICAEIQGRCLNMRSIGQYHFPRDPASVIIMKKTHKTTQYAPSLYCLHIYLFTGNAAKPSLSIIILKGSETPLALNVRLKRLVALICARRRDQKACQQRPRSHEVVLSRS